jgi:hypothetical protein
MGQERSSLSSSRGRSRKQTNAAPTIAKGRRIATYDYFVGALASEEAGAEFTTP